MANLLLTSPSSITHREFPRTIAVFRALQLGDLLCAVPCFRAIRQAWPQATISLVGLAWARSFVVRFHRYLDSFEEFPGLEGIPECGLDDSRMQRFRALGRCYDLAIQLHGNGSVTNRFLPELRPRLTAGFFVPGQHCPDPARFIAYPDGEHEIRRLLKLIEHLGLPLKGDYLEFPLTREDEHEAARLQTSGELRPGQFVCLHVGARDPQRRWPIEDFLEVAQGLAGRGVPLVLTGSPEEADQTALIRQRIGAACIDLAGKTSLGGLGALLKDARLLISNDTGVSHLAVAVGVPSVIVFSASDPKRWAPLDGGRHRALGDPTASPPGRVTPADVLTEADNLLAASPTRVEVRGGGAGVLPNVPWAGIKRLLLVYLGAAPDLLLIGPALRAAWVGRETTLLVSPADAWVASLLPGITQLLVDEVEALVEPIVERKVRLLVDRLRSQSFDAAILFSGACDHPYTAAYICCLAGIPVRIAASKEFGGALLSHWIRKLPDGLDMLDRSSSLLKAVGLACCEDEPAIVLPDGIEARVALDLRKSGADPRKGFVLADAALLPTLERPGSLEQRTGVPVVARPAGSPVGDSAALVKLSGIVVTADPVVARLADAFQRPLVATGAAAASDHWRPRRTLSKLLTGPEVNPEAVLKAMNLLLMIDEPSRQQGT